MGQRLDLHELLITLLGSGNVYFQPPPTVQMKYPCIVYELNDINTDFANDKPYNRHKNYLVTVIDRNPDSSLPDRVGELPLSNFDRFYTAENLNHNVFRLFY
jgi:hypothetical protein